MVELILTAAGTAYLCLHDTNKVLGPDDKVHAEKHLFSAMMIRLLGSGVVAVRMSYISYIVSIDLACLLLTSCARIQLIFPTATLA